MEVLKIGGGMLSDMPYLLGKTAASNHVSLARQSLLGTKVDTIHTYIHTYIGGLLRKLGLGWVC